LLIFEAALVIQNALKLPQISAIFIHTVTWGMSLGIISLQNITIAVIIVFRKKSNTCLIKVITIAVSSALKEAS